MKHNLIPENISIHLETVLKHRQGIDIMFPEEVEEKLKDKKLKAVFSSYPVYKRNGNTFELSCDIKPDYCYCYNRYNVVSVIKQISKNLKKLYDTYGEDMISFHEFGDLNVEELTVDDETGIINIFIGS